MAGSTEKTTPLILGPDGQPVRQSLEQTLAHVIAWLANDESITPMYAASRPETFTIDWAVRRAMKGPGGNVCAWAGALPPDRINIHVFLGWDHGLPRTGWLMRKGLNRLMQRYAFARKRARVERATELDIYAWRWRFMTHSAKYIMTRYDREDCVWIGHDKHHDEWILVHGLHVRARGADLREVIAAAPDEVAERVFDWATPIVSEEDRRKAKRASAREAALARRATADRS